MAELKKAIILNMKDTVATAILPVNKGDRVAIVYNNEVVDEITSLDDIELYHKIAIKPVDKGDYAYKYGEVIGKATDFIRPGQHVHINNIESVMTK
jgi:altronate dehydratase small subunit